MRVFLPYGNTGLYVEFPATVHVVEPNWVPGLLDEAAAIKQALDCPIGSAPLRHLVRPGDRAVIVHPDMTRPMPSRRVLPVLLRELEAAGLQPDHITLLNALGTHRRQTDQELEEMLGEPVVRGYRCLQHDCWDDANLVSLGLTHLGHPVRVNRTYLEADIRILTGFVEPHLFAGFSGGPKGVLPSIAGFDSVLTNHGAEMVRNPGATWGVTEGNPIWQEMMEVALMTRPTFILNITLNRQRAITGVFAGDLQAAHAAGRAFCRQSAMVPVPHLYDVVVTTNSGYPLDLNLYQSVKGMSAAAKIVKPGGSIVLVAECREGIPEHGEYARLLVGSDGPAAYLARMEEPGFACMDQWEAQVQALVQLRADVHLYADGMTDHQIRQSWLVPCRDLECRVVELLTDRGRNATLCVMPDGPQTIPYLS
jgi:nickel-dependent lactate racemase